MIINDRNMLLFWKYIVERHMIYKKKNILKNPSPWTADPILNQFKFTNVFRELDPGTKYVIEKIIPFTKSPENTIFNIIIYRLYNKIETFNSIGLQDVYSFDKKLLEEKLRELKSSGVKVFTNAFIVSGYSFIEGKDKIEKTCNIIESISKEMPPLTRDIFDRKDSEFTFNRIKCLIGIGDFLGYQIAVDIGYWNKELFDESRYVVAGPGCKAGLNRIFIDRGGLSYEGCIEYLVGVQKEWFSKIGIDRDALFDDRKERCLNLMSIENCLCEFSKYCKALYNEGRPRNRYAAK